MTYFGTFKYAHLSLYITMTITIVFLSYYMFWSRSSFILRFSNFSVYFNYFIDYKNKDQIIKIMSVTMTIIKSV